MHLILTKFANLIHLTVSANGSCAFSSNLLFNTPNHFSLWPAIHVTALPQILIHLDLAVAWQIQSVAAQLGAAEEFYVKRLLLQVTSSVHQVNEPLGELQIQL